MNKYALSIITCCLVLTALTVAEQKKITLTDGRVLIGEVEETDEGYQITLRQGAVITKTKEEVEKIEAFKTVQDEYQQKLDKIKEKGQHEDPEAHYKLAMWAYENDKLEIARKELKETIRLDPQHEKAKLLLRVVEGKIKGEKPTTPTDETKRPRPEISPKQLVSMEDIYKIRIEEIGADERVAVVFKDDVIERFIDMMLKRGEFNRAKAKAFRQLPDYRKLSVILENISVTDYGIKNDILIKSDPQVMKDFRNDVWPTVAQRCASVECHGSGGGKGGLKLYSVRGPDTRSLYTNFVLMNRFSTDRYRLIDRDNVEYSLLLQHGLPPRFATTKHPEEINPVFTDMKDRKYIAIENWIKSLAGPPAPDYRLNYKPASTTRPSKSGGVSSRK